jgi:hypothetical protein
LVEGVAVAATRTRDELSRDEWCAAMKERGFLPRLNEVFSLQFFGANASMAYTVSGAFIEYLIRQGHLDGVKKWYGGATFDQAFGAPIETMEHAWWQDLASMELSLDALKFVDARYHQPSVWGRTCPHVVERLRDQAGGCDARGDRRGELDALNRLLALDSHDAPARFARARMLEKITSKDAERLALIDLAADEKAGAAIRARALERLGDLYLSLSNGPMAIESYRASAKLVLEEDRLRTLDVKSWVAGDADRGKHLGAYFAGDAKLIASIVQLAEVTQSRSPDEQSLAHYLLARRLIDEKQWSLARTQLQLANPQRLEQISLRLPREAARLSMLIACFAPETSRETELQQARARIDSSRPTNGLRRWSEEIFERCSNPTANGVITNVR